MDAVGRQVTWPIYTTLAITVIYNFAVKFGCFFETNKENCKLIYLTSYSSYNHK